MIGGLRDANCKLCSLYKTANYVCVMGRGNSSSKVMLVGEAPGRDEDLQGKPFVGRCGRWLDRCLTALKMQDKVYITNVVRCRPPSNRKPLPVERHACWKYLEMEVELIQPRVIVAMGKSAAEALWFGAEVGKPFFRVETMGSYYGMRTWHPAYCLRAGKPKTTEFFEHLKWARKFVT